MFGFELPSFGRIIVLLFVTWLAWWTYKIDREESAKRKIKKDEERALLDNVTSLTTTRVKLERHLNTILNKVATNNIQSVVITDEKDIPQSVLIPYSQFQSYQLFQAHLTGAKKNNEEMRAQWAKGDEIASKDENYLKQLHDNFNSTRTSL